MTRTIEEAAQLLHERLREFAWYTTIGVGKYRNEPCIFLYVKSPNVPEVRQLRGEWMGYSVQVRQMSAPQPAGPQSTAAQPVW